MLTVLRAARAAQCAPFATKSGWGKFFDKGVAAGPSTAATATSATVSAPAAPAKAPTASSALAVADTSGDATDPSLPLPEIEEASNRMATSRRKAVKGSVKKMRELLFRIRNMSVDEAIRQMSFHQKHRRAEAIRAVLSNAKTNAVNIFNMDPARLYVDSIKTNKAYHLKRMVFHARGKTGIKHKQFCNLECVVKEWSSSSMSNHGGRLGSTSSERLKKRTFERERRQKWIELMRFKANANSKSAATVAL